MKWCTFLIIIGISNGCANMRLADIHDPIVQRRDLLLDGDLLHEGWKQNVGVTILGIGSLLGGWLGYDMLTKDAPSTPIKPRIGQVSVQTEKHIQFPTGKEGGFHINVKGFEELSSDDIQIDSYTPEFPGFSPQTIKDMVLKEINQDKYQNYSYTNAPPGSAIDWTKPYTIPDESVIIVFKDQPVHVNIFGSHHVFKLTSKVRLYGDVTTWPTKAAPSQMRSY